MAQDSTNEITSDTRVEADGDVGFSLELDELVNSLDAFQLFRKSDAAGAAGVLEDIGAHSKVDADIILELGSKRPLGPDKAHRFLEAHSLAVRSLEVLDRNGHRSIPVSKKFGFASPLAAFLAQLVTQYLVRSYLSKTIDEMRRLYIRREAAALPGDEHLPLLTRARIDTERLTPGFKKNALGVPTFLFGGAVLSGLAGVIQAAVVAAVGNPLILGVLLVVLLLLLVTASWAIVHGTKVARRRIHLTTLKPIKALWQTVGRAGEAPKDNSKAFAVIAIILTLAGFILLPLGFVAVLALLT